MPGTIFKSHGGKAYLASRILKLLKAAPAYHEPFVGAGAVLLQAKEWYPKCYASDIDYKIITVWHAIKENPIEFSQELCGILYNEVSFKKALNNQYPLAVNEFVLRKMSRGGLKRDFSWSNRFRGGYPECINSYYNSARLIAETELRDVEFAVASWEQAIRTENVMYYLDPPYLHETRTAPNVYEHEMSYEQHEELLKRITTMKAYFAISGYRSRLYDKYLKSWDRIEFDMPNHAGQGETKQRRTEVLWRNY